MDFRSVKLMRGLLSALALAWIAGCGGGSDEPVAQTPLPALLASAPVYGPATGPMPEDARRITVTELEQLATTHELTWFTPATERGVGNPLRDRLDRDRAFLESMLPTRPELAPVLEPVELPPGAVRRRDGTVEVKLPESDEVVVLDAPERRIPGLADALRKAESVPNALAVYRSLWQALAEDLRASLPTPDSAAGLTMDEIRSATVRAADLVLESVPSEVPAGDPLASFQQGGRARALSTVQSVQVGSNCTLSPFSPANDFNFTLKPHQPPIRSQGRRGSCVAFATTAAVEMKASRLFGLKRDLAEQHAYSMGKFDWFRTSDDMDDGLDLGDYIEKIFDKGYGFRGEATWTYNKSRDRIEMSDRYARSCLDYDEACSDTNHQLQKVSIVAGDQVWAAWARPATTQRGIAEEWRLNLVTFIGGMWPESFGALNRSRNTETLKLVRAVLAAGNPVMLGMAWPTCATQVRAKPTFLELTFGESSGLRAVLTNETCSELGGGAYNLFTGYHALNIVGFIPYSQIITRYAGNPRLPAIDGDLATDGWYIVRNSHGCSWGDAGYAYMSGSFLRRYANSFYAVNAVGAQNLGTVVLTPEKWSFGANDQVARFNVSYTGTIETLRFYVSKPDGSGYELRDEGAPPRDVQLNRQWMTQYAGSSGRFYVEAIDRGGNVFKSSVVQVAVPANAVPAPTSSPLVTLPNRNEPISSIAAPANVVLRTGGVSASMPIKRVDFLKGLKLLGTRTSEPFYSIPVALTSADIGRVTFIVRVEDTVGNFSTATVSIDVTAPLASPSIAAFAAAPASTAPGGGPVTLSWSASNFQELAIDKIGPVTNLSSVQVSPNVTTTYTLTATGNGGTTSASTTVTVPPPRIDSFTATPSSLPVGGGAVTLAWSVTGAPGVTISNVGTLPPSGTRVVNVSANTSWQLGAAAPSGTSFAQANVSVAQDTVLPTVSLAASPMTVDAPGSTTLTATATDNVGVVAVDFFRGSVRIGTDATPGDGFTQSVSLLQADAGNVSFSAVARDAGGNAASSLPVVVAVRVPSSADRYVSPTGSDSNPGTQAAPYLTVGKALANIGTNGTVWLAAGVYPWANEINRNGVSQLDFKTLRMPNNARLRALTRGTVTLQFGIVAQGVATVSGVHFTLVDSDVTDAQPAVVSVGAASLLRLERTTFGRMNTLLATSGGDITFTAEGDATHEWFASEFQGGFGRVDVGVTRVLGGRMTLTRVPDGGNASTRVWGIYGGSGLVSFESMRLSMPEPPSGVFQILFQPIAGGELNVVSSEVVAQGTRQAQVLAQNDHQSRVRIVSSTVSGPFAQVVSLTVGGNVDVSGSTLIGGVTGIGFAGGQEPGGVARPVVQVLDSTLRGFSSYGVHLPNHGEVTVLNSTIRDNGRAGIFMAGVPNLPWVTAEYALRMSGSTIAGNGSGGADQGGVVMAGSPTSVWNLGLNGQGVNVLLGANGSPALRLGVPSGVTVQASGNVWTPSVQGADTAGRYSGDLLVTGGSGTNYVINGAGALRLAP